MSNNDNFFEDIFLSGFKGCIFGLIIVVILALLAIAFVLVCKYPILLFVVIPVIFFGIRKLYCSIKSYNKDDRGNGTGNPWDYSD